MIALSVSIFILSFVMLNSSGPSQSPFLSLSLTPLLLSLFLNFRSLICVSLCLPPLMCLFSHSFSLHHFTKSFFFSQLFLASCSFLWFFLPLTHCYYISVSFLSHLLSILIPSFLSLSLPYCYFFFSLLAPFLCDPFTLSLSLSFLLWSLLSHFCCDPFSLTSVVIPISLSLSLILFCDHYIYISHFLSIVCPVGWSCRIYRLLLCRGIRPSPNKSLGYDTKQSNGEVPVMLGLWGMWSTRLLPSLPGHLWPGVVAPDKGSIYGLYRIKPWFLEFTFFAFELHIYAKLNCLE